MKKILSLLLAVILCLGLVACGETVEDPNAGKYLGYTAKAYGLIMQMSEIYPGETWLELESGGKGTLMLDGESVPAKWSVNEETITITVEDVDSVGTLKDGIITVDLMSMGCEMTFVKEGVEPPMVAATYLDAGYWDVVRVESDDPEACISEEDMVVLKETELAMYLELNADGTGSFYVDEEMPIVWQDGTFTDEEGLTWGYTVENGELFLTVDTVTMVFRRGEKPEQTQEEIPEETVVQSDAGFYDLLRIDSNVSGDASSEEDIQMLKSTGYELYLELMEDGTGIFCVGSPMDVIWGDGFIEAEGEAFPYLVEGNLLMLGDEEIMFVFCRSES